VDNTVGLGIAYTIGKDRRDAVSIRCASNDSLKILTIEQVVTKNQRARLPGKELFTDDQCLRDPFWPRLASVGELEPPLCAVAQKLCRATACRSKF